MEDKLEKGQWRKWKPGYEHYRGTAPKQFTVGVTGGFYTSYLYLGGERTGCLESDIVLRHSDPCGRIESLALEYADNKAVTFDHYPYHLGQGFVAVKVGEHRFSFASDGNPRQDKAPLSQLVGMVEAALREHKRKMKAEPSPNPFKEPVTKEQCNGSSPEPVYARQPSFGDRVMSTFLTADNLLLKESADKLKVENASLKTENGFLRDRVDHLVKLAESRAGELERQRVIIDNTTRPQRDLPGIVAPTVQEREVLTGQIRILNQVLKETTEDRQRLQEKNRELALLVSDPGKTQQRMIDDLARMMSLSGYTSWKAILSEVDKMHCRLRRLESAFKGA